MNRKKAFLILDFGSQYTWLIARSLREMGFYAEVEPYSISIDLIEKKAPRGIILSGGPSSVLSPDSPVRNLKPLVKISPLMGICYGMQLICHQWGGRLKSSDLRNYGKSLIYWKTKDIPLEKIKNLSLEDSLTMKVWMSHGDHIFQVPKDFVTLAETENKAPAVVEFQNIFAVQFHPEVSHTDKGKNILSYFVKKVCGAETKEWTAGNMLQSVKHNLKTQVDSDSLILCALSGGVDSTVLAMLLNEVLDSSRLRLVFVDTGLLRQNEFQEILTEYKKWNLNVEGLQKEGLFLSALKGITDPEKKRKIIGKLFIDVFKNYKDQNPDIKYLAQGTLYPDVIESVSVKGPSAVIKSHHNVGGLPKELPFKLVEPLKFLFKDEVRSLGIHLGLPDKWLSRHPFPGPGLAVRICGEITKDRLQKLRCADFIFIEEIKKAGLYLKIWQALAVLLPVRSVGVQGDQRTYDEVIVLRAVTSKDGMTADWFSFSEEFLHRVSDRIINEVKGVNRVVYDISSKPPGTIEWL